MTTFALLHPTSLLGEELLRELSRRSDSWDRIKLLSDDEEEVGQLTEISGGAGLVQRLEDGDLASSDVVFFCGSIEQSRPLLPNIPEGTTAVLLSTGATTADGRPVVSGVNDPGVAPGGVLLSPHPGAMLVAHLLTALSRKSPSRATVTVTQPASVLGKKGMDELFEQTRAILAFNPERPEALWGRQLAFNHFPPPSGQPYLTEPLSAQILPCLARPLPLAATLVQGGHFHGVSASLWVELGEGEDPGLDAVIAALATYPNVDVIGEGETIPSPVEAANRGQILVGPVRAEPGAEGSYWIWAVMDNLTLGGAVNAVDIAEAVVAAGAVS